jgi:hypothetical protein
MIARGPNDTEPCGPPVEQEPWAVRRMDRREDDDRIRAADAARRPRRSPASDDTEPCGPPVEEGPRRVQPAERREHDDRARVALAARTLQSHPTAEGQRSVGPHAVRDGTKGPIGEEIRRLLQSVGRDRPSHPLPVRRCSDGGNFVRYSGTAFPVPARKPEPELPSVVIADREDHALREDPTQVGAQGDRPRFSRMVRRD